MSNEIIELNVTEDDLKKDIFDLFNIKITDENKLSIIADRLKDYMWESYCNNLIIITEELLKEE